MKYVNKLPSHKRNSNLMATLQAGPPGRTEMSIFITRPPLHPHLRGRQGGFMSLPPMHIIPSTKEEGIRKGKAISLKYQNKEDMKGKERMKGEINYTKVDKKYRREKASEQWGKRRRWSRSWCSIWEWMYAGCSLREQGYLCTVCYIILFESHQLSPQRFAPPFCKTATQEDTLHFTPLSIKGLNDTWTGCLWQVSDIRVVALSWNDMVHTGLADWPSEGWIPKTGHSKVTLTAQRMM